MMTLVALIDRVAPGLYFLVVALCLWLLWRWRAARSEYRSTYFELERDLARLRQVNALTLLLVLLLLALLILGVQRSVLPFLQQEDSLLIARAEQAAAREDGTFVTSTPPPAAGGAFDVVPVPPLGGDNNPVIQLTPTLTPTPVGTIIPNPPLVQGCNDPRATLQIPTNGMRVFQPIRVVGTAFSDNFAFAKIEISGPGTNNIYGVVDQTLQPVTAVSDFSQFAPAGYAEGLYQFRLMVFDISQLPVASCMVNIYISAPPVTPTPTPTPGGA
ncbi:MAG: hypothetical protein MUE40_21490 [Anaerolineae bacterium]|jgi:hypothetical protein|nr:hypothetical protein [Anaerolineae bacterium]